MSDKLLFAAETAFESARKITLHPEEHRSHRLHGHSFIAKVRAVLPPEWIGFPGAEVGQLRECLSQCIAPLDYRLLNEYLEQPTDINLAVWIRNRLRLPGIEQVGIQSAPHTGVEIDGNEHAHIWRRYLFESAHRLPNVPPGHKCGRMHGHGFEAVLHADATLNHGRTAIDHDFLDKLWAPIHAEIHEACLNDIEGLENPTSELIGSYIWRRIKPLLPELSWVTVYETASCGAHFDGERYRIWKELSLDSSLRLKHASKGDPRRRIHGHTYKLRLHLTAPLDPVRGWTMDFGEMKKVFKPIFLKLDHQPLHELAGVEDNDAGSLVRWIRTQAAADIPQLDRIDLFETRGCGAVLCWGDKLALPV